MLLKRFTLNYDKYYSSNSSNSNSFYTRLRKKTRTFCLYFNSRKKTKTIFVLRNHDTYYRSESKCITTLKVGAFKFAWIHSQFIFCGIECLYWFAIFSYVLNLIFNQVEWKSWSFCVIFFLNTAKSPPYRFTLKLYTQYNFNIIRFEPPSVQHGNNYKWFGTILFVSSWQRL